MRKNFFKKIFVSLVLITMLGVISAGCGTTAPPIGPVGCKCQALFPSLR